MRNLKEVQKLSRKDLKHVMGGGPLDPVGCNCFCYTGNVKSKHSCRTLCADGSIPGVDSFPEGGSASDCGYPPQLH